jgi:tRNA threonylcarbamoyladenosine biosynthesis protein TsaB
VLILAVHSTSPILSAAIALNGERLAEKALPASRQHLENIADLVKGLVIDSGLEFSQFDAFACASGPGSFSGIRIGMSLIKGLAIALGKPAIGVSSLEIQAWSALRFGENGISVIDARRGEVFVGFYSKSDAGLTELRPPVLMALDNLLEETTHLGARFVLCAERDWLPACYIETRPVEPAASACAILASQNILSPGLYDVHRLSPIYLRRSDAEEKKR